MAAVKNTMIVEQFTIECTSRLKSKWSGVEWNGVEWSGVEWGGVEWSGLEVSGVRWS